MDQFERYRATQFRQIRLGGWRAVLLMAVAGAVALALVTIFGLLFLITLPILVVAGFIARWLLLREIKRVARERRSRAPGGVIETDYEVVEESDRRL
jgi:hypothetical protein